MKVQDLCTLKETYKNSLPVQNEILDFAIHKIHYSYYFDFFGHFMNANPQLLDFPMFQDISCSFNAFSFCQLNYYHGIYLDYFLKIEENLFGNPFVQRYQKGDDKSAVSDYLNQFQQNLVFDMIPKWNSYAQEAYRDLEKNIGSSLYFLLAAKLNILLKNYIEDIINISKINPCHSLPQDISLLWKVSEINDSEVLKYVYNCLVLARLLDFPKINNEIPFFVQTKFSQFHDVSQEIQSHLSNSQDYKYLPYIFQSLLNDYKRNHIDGEIYSNLLHLLNSGDYSWSMIEQQLSYFTASSFGVYPLYLVSDKNTLGSKENEVENSVDFLKPEFYQRSRMKS